jgi:hypothetical protein
MKSRQPKPVQIDVVPWYSEDSLLTLSENSYLMIQPYSEGLTPAQLSGYVLYNTGD